MCFNIYVQLLNTQNKNEDQAVILLSYHYDENTLHVQKFMYDVSAVLGMWGGSLGMILGVSFYSMGKLVIDKFCSH